MTAAPAIAKSQLHSLTRPNMVSVGTIVWLSSELMFFAALFGMYFTLRAEAAPALWTPPDIKVDGLRLFFTSVLIASSGTMQMAVHRIKQGNVSSMRRWTVLTMVMGITFLAGQAHEWINLPFTIASDAYGSAFYAMTGFHGLHVFAGLLIMMVMLGRAATGAYSDREYAGVEVTAYYWHFVDIVWIGLFTTIFVIR